MRAGLSLLLFPFQDPSLSVQGAGSVCGGTILGIGFVVRSDFFFFGADCPTDWCRCGAAQIYTKEGLELARATLVNVKGETVYDELVKPT